MRRANSQKVYLILLCAIGNKTTRYTKQALPQDYSRARKSAAMVGIALSVGVTGILTPYKSARAEVVEKLGPFASISPSPLWATARTIETAVKPTPSLPSTQVSPADSVPTITAPPPLAVSGVAKYPVQPMTTLDLEPTATVTPLPSRITATTIKARVKQPISLPTPQLATIGSATLPISSPLAASAATKSLVKPLAVSQSIPQPFRVGVLPTAVSSPSAVSVASKTPVKLATPVPIVQPVVESATTPKKDGPKAAIAASTPTQTPEQVEQLDPAQPIAVDNKLAESVIANVRQKAPVTLEAAAYQVKPGDTLETIAKNHQVSAQVLVKGNQLTNPNLILTGQTLKIFSPQTEHSQETASISGPTQAVDSGVTFTATDTHLFTLKGGSTAALPTASKENRPGPTTRTVVSAPSATSELSIHQIKPRDTLETIAKNYQVSTQALIKANRLANPNLILAGRTLNLPAQIEKKTSDYKVAALPTSGTGVVSDSLPPVPGVIRSSVPTNGSGANISFGVGTRISQAHTAQGTKPPRSLAVTSRTLPQQKTSNPATTTPPTYVAIVKRTVLPQLTRLELPPLAAVDAYLPPVQPDTSTSTGQYISPANGVLTSGFGRRWGRMHRGIDIAAPVGTPVLASAPGVVVASGWNSGGYGNLVEIEHPGGGLTLYAHNSRLLARKGQQVGQGQQIAEMGSTGRSTGPHLHFEVHLPGKGAVNPLFYLARR